MVIISFWELTQEMRGWDMNVYRCKNTKKRMNSAASDSVVTALGAEYTRPPSVTSALTLRPGRMSNVSPEHPIRNKHRCPEFHVHLEHLVDPFLPSGRRTSAHFCPQANVNPIERWPERRLNRKMTNAASIPSPGLPVFQVRWRMKSFWSDHIYNQQHQFTTSQWNSFMFMKGNWHIYRLKMTEIGFSHKGSRDFLMHL